MKRRIIQRIMSAFSLLMLVVLAVSCEHAFPNDDLDFYWRLETIEHKGGATQTVSNTMFGFARHIVLIEDISRGFSRHGITTDTGDSIKFDFSIYPDTAMMMKSLRYCGIDSVVTTFGVGYPKGGLILSNDNVVLTLKKW